MAMAAVVRSPIHVCAPRTRKATFTRSPSRPTEVTSPTLTPAIRTSSPSSSPAASLKSAEYVVPPPTRGRLVALKATYRTRASAARPTSATATGLRSFTGVKRGGFAGVMTGTSLR
ncbi:hypothetical protein GA0115246_1045710 [Streptomyces sp. SolWspMP-sol7th]|nr:hypothetical protein GA0115246_1045710 [Streptomyces sp. SolWspMP-sol7th]